MSGRDLARSATSRAKAAFVLCNKFASDVDAEDSSTILRALSLKRHVFEVRQSVCRCRACAA